MLIIKYIAKLTCLHHCIERIKQPFLYKNCAIFRIQRVRRDSTPWVLFTTETVTVQYWCTTSQTKTHSRRSVHVHWKYVVLHVLCFRQGRLRGLNSWSCVVMWNEPVGKMGMLLQDIPVACSSYMYMFSPPND